MEIGLYIVVGIVSFLGIAIAIGNFIDKTLIGINENEEEKVIEFVEPKPKKIIIKDKDKIVGKVIIDRYGIYLFDINNERVNQLYSFLETLSEINEIFKEEEIDIKDFYFIRLEFKRHYKEKHQANMTKLRYGIEG